MNNIDFSKKYICNFPSGYTELVSIKINEGITAPTLIGFPDNEKTLEASSVKEFENLFKSKRLEDGKV